MDEWLATCAKLEDKNAVPLYDGSCIAGGVADNHALVVELLRLKFSNKTLFSGRGETQLVAKGTLDRDALLGKLLELVSAHRRNDARPVLQHAVEGFLAVTQECQGTLAAIDVPYFVVSCYSFPVRAGAGNDEAQPPHRVAYLYWAHWMTGVC